MPYRANVRLDFGEKNNNEYQKLIAALMQAGWVYLETSSMFVETDDITVVLRGFEILARQIPLAGMVSGILFDVVRANSFIGEAYSAANNHPNALADVRARPLPV